MISPSKNPRYLKLFLIGFHYVFSTWFNQKLYGADDTIKILSENQPSIIISRLPGNLSTDPINGEHRWDSWMMQFIYAKIMKLDQNNNLVSEILEEFQYLPKNKEIRLKIKKNLYFQNGKPIEAEDIFTSLLRTALKYKKHPLTSQIVGIQQWFALKAPLKSLPTGLVKTSPDSILIRLNDSISNPLEKLTLNTFFIIPSQSVNPSDGSLYDKNPSASGHYHISKRSPGHIELTSRPLVNSTLSSSPQRKLNLLFIPPAKFIRYIDYFQPRHLFLADQIHIPKDHLNIIQKKFKVSSTPEFRHFAIKLNPRTEPFKDLRVRQFFSMEFRKTIEEFFGQSDGSLISKIMPGYISQSKLSSQIPVFSQDETCKILEKLKKNPPVYAQLNGETIGLESFQYFYRLTLKRLEIRERPPLILTNIRELNHNWKKGVLSIGWIFSGLQGEELTDSIQVLTSNDLCNQFGDIREDPFIKKMTLAFLSEQNERLKIDKLKEINSYLYQQSVLSVMTNYSYITIAHKNDQLNAQTTWASYFATSLKDYVSGVF